MTEAQIDKAISDALVYVYPPMMGESPRQFAERVAEQIRKELRLALAREAAP